VEYKRSIPKIHATGEGFRTYLAVSSCICCSIPLYLVSFTYLTASKTGYGQKYTPQATGGEGFLYAAKKKSCSRPYFNMIHCYVICVYVYVYIYICMSHFIWVYVPLSLSCMCMCIYIYTCMCMLASLKGRVVHTYNVSHIMTYPFRNTVSIYHINEEA